MTAPARIEPDSFYDDRAALLLMGLRPASLARGRKSGELRFTRRGGRILYLGRWLETWLTADAGTDQAQTGAGAGAA